jgi:acetyl esterase/lipase
MFYSYFKKNFLNFKNVFRDNDEPRLKKEVYPDNVSQEVFDYLGDGNEYHKFNLYKLTDNNEVKPLIIDIHGGAWVYGTKDLKKAFCTSFAERGYDVISMSYRLIDDVLMKDIIKDIFNCLNYIDTHKEELGVSFDKVLLTGDSAGGHLALVVSKLLNDPVLANELGLKIPNFIVKGALLNHAVPFTDIAGKIVGHPFLSMVAIPGVREILYGKKYKKDIWYKKLASPYTYINKDTKLPKLIVITSKADELYYYQSEMLKKLFDDNSVDFEYHCSDHKDAWHVYNSILPYTEIGIEANDKIDQFFKKL